MRIQDAIDWDIKGLENSPYKIIIYLTAYSAFPPLLNSRAFHSIFLE